MFPKPISLESNKYYKEEIEFYNKYLVPRPRLISKLYKMSNKEYSLLIFLRKLIMEYGFYNKKELLRFISTTPIKGWEFLACCQPDLQVIKINFITPKLIEQNFNNIIYGFIIQVYDNTHNNYILKIYIDELKQDISDGTKIELQKLMSFDNERRKNKLGYHIESRQYYHLDINADTNSYYAPNVHSLLGKLKDIYFNKEL